MSTSTQYEINVAFKGRHDFTVTVGRRGPLDPDHGSAVYVKQLLQDNLGDAYSVTLLECNTTTFRQQVSSHD